MNDYNPNFEDSLELLLVTLAWQAGDRPDLASLAAAVPDMPKDALDAVADWHCLPHYVPDDPAEYGAEVDDDGNLLPYDTDALIANAARTATATTIPGLNELFDRSGRTITLVRAGDWRVLLAGGMSAGEEPPLDNWEEWMTIGSSGLLTPDANHQGTAGEWNAIDGPSQFQVFALKPTVEWDRATALLDAAARAAAAAADPTDWERFDSGIAQLQIGHERLIAFDGDWWPAIHARDHLTSSGELATIAIELPDLRLRPTSEPGGR